MFEMENHNTKIRGCWSSTDWSDVTLIGPLNFVPDRIGQVLLKCKSSSNTLCDMRKITGNVLPTVDNSLSYKPDLSPEFLHSIQIICVYDFKPPHVMTHTAIH